jgi:hypothetical protein
MQFVLVFKGQVIGNILTSLRSCPAPRRADEDNAWLEAKSVCPIQFCTVRKSNPATAHEYKKVAPNLCSQTDW